MATFLESNFILSYEFFLLFSSRPLLFFSFSRPTVLFFKLTAGANKDTYRLAFQYRLEVDSAVGDIAFVDASNMLVLQSPRDGASSIFAYTLHDQSESITVGES